MVPHLPIFVPHVMLRVMGRVRTLVEKDHSSPDPVTEAQLMAHENAPVGRQTIDSGRLMIVQVPRSPTPVRDFPDILTDYG